MSLLCWLLQPGNWRSGRSEQESVGRASSHSREKSQYSELLEQQQRVAYNNITTKGVIHRKPMCSSDRRLSKCTSLKPHCVAKRRSHDSSVDARSAKR